MTEPARQRLAGEVVPRDEAGDAGAVTALGGVHRDGTSMPPDRDQASDRLWRSADEGRFGIAARGSKSRWRRAE